MSRAAARTTQADIARAIRAARQCGVSMSIEIMPDGIIRLTTEKTGGPVANEDQRHSVCEHDPATGQFRGKARAGRLLDGVEHNGFPTPAKIGGDA